MVPAMIMRQYLERVEAGEDVTVDYSHQRPGIYMIYCRANERGYIGSSCNVYDRWGLHRGDLVNDAHPSKPLMNSWRKYGASAFDFAMIELCQTGLTKQQLVDRENAWLVPAADIDLRSVFNTEIPAKVGRGPGFTYQHTEEAKEKIRQSKLGKPGHIPSEETRLKMALASGQRRHTPEAKFKNMMASATRLTPAQVVEIRRLRAGGMKLAEVGEKFGLNASTVCAICKRHVWKHLP